MVVGVACGNGAWDYSEELEVRKDEGSVKKEWCLCTLKMLNIFFRERY